MNIKNLVALVFSGIILFSGAQQNAEAITIQAGLIDGFSLPSEAATPSPELAAILTSSSGGIQGFDLIAGVNGGSEDTQVAHTFTGLPGTITAGSLEMRVQAGSNAGIFSDGLILSFVDSSTVSWKDDIVFGRTFGSSLGSSNPAAIFADPDPGLLQSTPWSTGDDFTFTLDLAALPLAAGGTLNLLPAIASHGFLDVTVSDETGVDFMTLTLGTPKHVPEPSTWLLMGGGLAGLFFWGRREQGKA